MKKVMLFVLVIILTSGWAVPVFGDQLQDIQDMMSSIDGKINDLNKMKQDAKSKLNTTQSEQKKILDKQNEIDKEFNKLVKEANGLSNEVKGLDVEIAKAEENYKKQNEIVKTRIRTIYENAGETSYFDSLLESKDVTDFLERLELISLISAKDKELLDAMVTAKKDVEYKRQITADKKQDKTKQAIDIQKNLNAVSVSRANLDSQIRSINANINSLEAQEDQLLKKSNELSAVIRGLVKNGGSYTGGEMIWPTPSSGAVSSYFGNRLHPILKKYRMHTGIDINVGAGKSIVAANSGTVILAGWQSDYGNTVIIDHGGGISTLYAHCSALLCATGNYVEAGQTIAKVGSTGLATGPHLHFEVRVNGEVVNPLDYVSPP